MPRPYRHVRDLPHERRLDRPVIHVRDVDVKIGLVLALLPVPVAPKPLGVALPEVPAGVRLREVPSLEPLLTSPDVRPNLHDPIGLGNARASFNTALVLDHLPLILKNAGVKTVTID